MERGSRKWLLIGSLIVLLLALGGAGGVLVSKLLHLDSYKNELLAQMEQSLGRKVVYEKGDFSLRFGPAFTFTKVVVKEKDTLADFITADKLTFKIAVLPLLEKKVVIRDLIFEKPIINLFRYHDATLNIGDLLEGKKEGTPLQVRGAQLRKGTVRFTDLAVAPEAVTTSLEETDLSIDHLRRGKSSDIELSAFLVSGGKRGVITLSGSVKTAAQGQPLTETFANLKVFLKDIDAGHYWPYYSRYVPFRQITGHIELDGSLKGKLSSFVSRGTVKINGLRFDYPQIFHAVLTPRDLHFKYDMELTPHDVLVKSLDLTVDTLAVKGSCAIRDIHTGDPRITARANTSRFRLEEFGSYIPYGIIVKGTADFIEQHIKGGTYKLDDGRLDGRVSQIVHMERGDNYNVLSIAGKVEKGIVNYGRSIPAFTNIKGELELRGKDFSLNRMSGNFGGSPFTLDGKITDYPLETPSGYPFTMNITPRQGETAWLFGWLKGKKPVVNGDSRVRLKGEGTTSEYRLAGDWDLTTASYTYDDLIAKPAGRANTVAFRGTITGQEAKFNLIQFSLPPLALSLSGAYRFADRPAVALDIRSNQFQLNEVAAMLPLAKRYQAGGRIQANVHAEGEGSELSGIRWSGAISFAGFTCKPTEQIKTVSNVNGSITFNGTNLETSQLAVRLGTSTIYGKGKLEGFKNPTLNLVFSSPLLNMADLGLHAPDKEVRIAKLSGDVSLKDNNLRIKSLSGKVANTSLSVAGTVINLSNPKADIVVTSPHLEVADIIPLTALQQARKGEGPSPRLSLKAAIAADSGKIDTVDFSDLTTVVMYEDKILYLQPAECALLGGRLTARGRADFNSALPRTQVSFNLSKVSAEHFLKALGVNKQEITGKLSLQGELTAKGKEAADIKKTLLGSVRLHCEEGTLRRFAILSKIFSILNVSQLLKFRLPDMVSGGMPYNHISATFSVRDGIVSSSDLYLASNAMNISAVGKVDMIREEVDATIGVQPLQTIDKVVSKIPIVGWLLTGKDKSLISAYFEAKGKLDDPQVSAIPVKSMAKGALDIFKRLFELPAKLFTDTGEVIINK